LFSKLNPCSKKGFTYVVVPAAVVQIHVQQQPLLPVHLLFPLQMGQLHVGRCFRCFRCFRHFTLPWKSKTVEHHSNHSINLDFTTMVHATMNTVNNLPPPFAVLVAPRLRRAKVCVNVLVGEVGGLSGLRCTWENDPLH